VAPQNVLDPVNFDDVDAHSELRTHASKSYGTRTVSAWRPSTHAGYP
jgi:hypothetical protein